MQIKLINFVGARFYFPEETLTYDTVWVNMEEEKNIWCTKFERMVLVN